MEPEGVIGTFITQDQLFIGLITKSSKNVQMMKNILASKQYNDLNYHQLRPEELQRNVSRVRENLVSMVSEGETILHH